MYHTIREEYSHPNVLVIGAAGLDIVGRPNTSAKPAETTPAVVRPSFGGVARNVAENLGRLGQPVDLISAVGMDAFGDQLLTYTANAGVNIEPVLRCADCNTGSYLAVLEPQGTLNFAFYDMRALAILTPSLLRERRKLFQQAGLIFVDANLSPASLKAVFNLAHQYKTPVCADCTTSLLAPRLTPYLSKLQLLNANTHEVSILTGRPVPPDDIDQVMEAAHSLVEHGVEIAVVSMAEQGVCYATSEINGHISAISTQIFDPTGAGDALSAALIFGLMNEIPIDDAIRMGVSAASLTLQHAGSVYPQLSLQLLYDRLIV